MIATEPTLRDRIGQGPWWLARIVLVAASVVALLSFGGQVVLAPVLLPLLWGAAKNSESAGRALFLVLSSLLMVEFGWIVGYLATNNELAGGILGLAAALLGTYFFYRSTQPSAPAA